MNEQHMIDEKILETVMFTNYSNEDLTFNLNLYNDGKIQTFTVPAGTSKYMEQFKADHAASILVDRELQKKGMEVNHFSRGSELKKCFAPIQDILATVAPTAQTAPTPTPEKPKKRMGRPPKVKVEDIESFEGKEEIKEEKL